MSDNQLTRPVVVGFDGGPASEDALALARPCSRVLDAPTIVAVVHPSHPPISPARVDAEWIADRHRLAEEVVDRARALLAEAGEGSPPVEYRIVASASAAHGLHNLAEEVDAALVVVGSGSEGTEHRLFAGTTADRLLSGSVFPVAVAPVGMRNRPPRELTRIGFAYINTPEAHAALAVAARLAERASAELRLYTVMAYEAEVLPLIGGRDAENAFVATAREEFQGALDRAIAGLPPGVRATGTVLTGNVVDVLAELDESEIDVLFCGSRGYGPVRRVLLGGVSVRLVRRARSPVVVVPRGE